MSDVIEKTKLNERLSRVTETYRNPCVQHKREEKQTRKKYCMFSNTIYCVVSTFTNQTSGFRRKTCCTTMCTQYNSTPTPTRLFIRLTTCQTACVMLDLRFSQQSWYAFKASGMWQSKKRDCFMLKMKALCAFEMLGPTQPSTHSVTSQET